MGAVPLKAANRSRVGNLAMSPVMPTTVAATTGGDAEDVDDAGAGRYDHLLEALLRLGDLAVDSAQVIEELLGELDAGGGHGAVGLDLGEQERRLVGVDLVRDAASDQVAQHRVQAAGDLGAGARQVAVTRAQIFITAA